MQTKITNPDYKYNENGTLLFTATCQLFDDHNKFLFDKEIEATGSLADPDLYSKLQSDLIAQRNEIKSMYAQMIAPVAVLFPCCSTPAEIASMIARRVEEAD